LPSLPRIFFAKFIAKFLAKSLCQVFPAEFRYDRVFLALICLQQNDTWAQTTESESGGDKARPAANGGARR
jgi:hypothetical protein